MRKTIASRRSPGPSPSVSEAMPKLLYSAATHEGKLRPNNEDNFWIDCYTRKDVAQNRMRCEGKIKPSRFVAAVCDGMGGESCGEIASLLAAECVQPHTFYELPEAAVADVQTANRKVCGYITEHGGIRSGSTWAVLYIDSGRAVCCNVGDSRVYRLHDGQLTQLSVDHNRAQRMVETGLMTEVEARSSAEKHTLTQYLGIFEEEMVLEPWVSPPVELVPGDCFLLCSDGLTDMLWDAEISQILSEKSSPSAQAAHLVQEALDSGGRDNITVIVIHVRDIL